MTQASNVITLPLPGSVRPTVPPETSVPAPHPLEGDPLAKSVSSVVAGLGHGLSRSGGSGGSNNWLAGFIVAVGLLVTSAVGWLTVEIRDMGSALDGMRTDHAAQVQAQIVRDTAQDNRQDAVVDAVLAIHDEQRASDRWTHRILLDNWMKQNPDREPPQPPDTDSNDRIFLNLR